MVEKYAEVVYSIEKNEFDDLVHRLGMKGFNVLSQGLTRKEVYHEVSTKPVGYFDRHFQGAHFFVLSSEHLEIETNPLIGFMKNYK